MKIQIPKVFAHADRALESFAREVRRALEIVVESPSVSGQYLVTDTGSVDIPLTNGSVNRLRHRLGRKLKGWSIRDLRRSDGTAIASTGRITRVTVSGVGTANDETELWLDVQGWTANVIARIVVE